MGRTDEQLTLLDRLIQVAVPYADLEPGIRDPDPLRRAVASAFIRSLGRMEVLRLLLERWHPDEMWPLMRPMLEDSQWLRMAADRPSERWAIVRAWWERQIQEMDGYAHEEARQQREERYVGLERFVNDRRSELAALPDMGYPNIGKTARARAAILGEPTDDLDWLWSTKVAHSTVASLFLHAQAVGRPHATIGLHDVTPLHHNHAAWAAARYFTRLATATGELLGWPPEPMATTASAVVAEFKGLDNLLHPMGRWDRRGRPLSRGGNGGS